MSLLDPQEIPPDLNTPDVFLPLGPLKLSLPQTVISVGSFVGWWAVANYMVGPLLGLTLLFSMILCFPLVVFGLAAAFVKVRGRPIDIFLAEMFSYKFGPRVFVRRAPDAQGGLEADLDRDPDAEEMLDYLERPRVVR